MAAKLKPRFGVFHFQAVTPIGKAPLYDAAEALFTSPHERVAQRWADLRNEKQIAAGAVATHVVRTLFYCRGFNPDTMAEPPAGKPSLFHQRF